MRLKVDPLRDVFFVGDLAHDELLSEVLMVDNVGRVANHVLDLSSHIAKAGEVKTEFAKERMAIFSDIFNLKLACAASIIEK